MWVRDSKLMIQEGLRFIKSLRRPNKPVELFALRDAQGDRLLLSRGGMGWDGQESLASVVVLVGSGSGAGPAGACI